MIPRRLEKKIKELSKGYPVITLTGPRQSGKTTLIKKVFKGYKYLNLESLDIRMAAEADPRGFLSLDGEKGMIIDEAQRVPVLFSYLQNIVDESGKMGKYVLSGSQHFLLLEKITQSLAGRVAVLHLLAFDELELQKASLMKKTLNETLFYGMYPAIYARNLKPSDFYQMYAETYIDRDVRSIINIGNLSLFRSFVKLCAGRTGQLLNLSEIGGELGIDRKTVQAWLSILESSFIIFLLRPYHKNFNKRLVKHPKLYFYDTGLLCSLLGIEKAEQLDTHYLRGGIFESFVISEYFKQTMHAGKRPDAYFWRDINGSEVDLVIEKGQDLSAIEIKSGATVNDEFFKGLTAFSELTNTPSENCALVYGGIADMKRKAMHVVPWQKIGKISTLK